jgi:2,3-bisphosphoglycerate-dependent phosphoglycerate mutase
MPFADKAKLTVHTDSRWSERILSNEPRTDWLACLERTFAEPDLCYPGGESSRCAAERALAALDGLLALGHTAYAVATHGNLMSLLLKHYNEQFGFAEWKSLSNPDVYRLNFSGGRFQKMSRIWNG